MSFEFINDLKPQEVREHLDTIHKLSQCPKEEYWESYSIIDSFLTAKGLAAPCPKRTTIEVIKNNKIHFRKENKS